MEQIRKAVGLSKPALAHEMGISEKQYGRYEARGEMPRGRAGTYAAVVGIPFEQLSTVSQSALSEAVETAVQALLGAASAVAATGAQSVETLGALRPLLEEQRALVAQMKNLVEELKRREAAS